MTFICIFVAFAVRALLVLLFLPFSALDKILNFKQAVGQAAEAVPSRSLAAVMIFAGLGVEVLMSSAVLTGIADRMAALVLAALLHRHRPALEAILESAGFPPERCKPRQRRLLGFPEEPCARAEAFWRWRSAPAQAVCRFSGASVGIVASLRVQHTGGCVMADRPTVPYWHLWTGRRRRQPAEAVRNDRIRIEVDEGAGRSAMARQQDQRQNDGHGHRTAGRLDRHLA